MTRLIDAQSRANSTAHLEGGVEFIVSPTRRGHVVITVRQAYEPETRLTFTPKDALAYLAAAGDDIERAQAYDAFVLGENPK